MDDAELKIGTKIKEWFEREGYPLEFRTAKAFTENAFHAQQGTYVRDEESKCVREIDVVADFTAEFSSGKWLRISHVVECKWSMDKPWVLFTSTGSIMAPSAHIAQTLGSSLGEAVLHCIAGDTELAELGLFRQADRGAFGGRRAFEDSKGSTDLVYNTFNGVVSKSSLIASSYDKTRREGRFPNFGAICLPLVVVQGLLFEAHYDWESADVVLAPVTNARIFWRGSVANPGISVIDVVTEAALDPFLKKRRSDIEFLMRRSCEGAVQIELAFRNVTLEGLELVGVPRGYVGLPRLLRELHENISAKSPS